MELEVSISFSTKLQFRLITAKDGQQNTLNSKHEFSRSLQTNISYIPPVFSERSTIISTFITKLNHDT